MGEIESSAGLTAMIPKRTVRVCIVTGMDLYAYTLFESVFYSVGVICTPAECFFHVLEGVIDGRELFAQDRWGYEDFGEVVGSFERDRTRGIGCRARQRIGTSKSLRPFLPYLSP